MIIACTVTPFNDASLDKRSTGHGNILMYKMETEFSSDTSLRYESGFVFMPLDFEL